MSMIACKDNLAGIVQKVGDKDHFTALQDGSAWKSVADAGCWVRGHVQLEYLINEPVAPLLATALVIAALALIAFYFVVIYLPLKSNLYKANKAIDQSMAGGNHGNDDARRMVFARNFASLGHQLRDNKALKHGWREFQETLILPDDPGREVVRNMVRPQTYINIRELSGRKLSPKFLAIFPNLFVGIGLLLGSGLIKPAP